MSEATAPSVISQWTAVLRSGEYQQGAGLLRKGDEFCCLGVLCDLAVKAGVGEWADGSWVNGVGDFRVNTFLPGKVRRWANLPDSFGLFGLPETLGEPLSSLNDQCVPFPEIADIIDREWGQS